MCLCLLACLSLRVCLSLLVGVFASVPLMVREPSGKYTPEHIWSRGGV
jgi:hypothetical protein